MARMIERDELKALLSDGTTVVVEVLPPPEYQRLHIQGAINIPIERIGREASARFEKDRAIVVYCADRECPTSGQAATKLETFGFTKVLEYAGGKADWEQGGLPTETGDAARQGR